MSRKAVTRTSPPLGRHDARRRPCPIAGAQSISRAAAVLRAVGTARGQAATLSNVAQLVGLKTATARRLLQALAAEGFLTFDAQKKTYQIGPDLIALTASGDDVFATRDVLMAACREVAAKTSDTTLLSVRRGDFAICIGRVEGAFPIRVMSLDIGGVRPLGAGSGSLALLAFLPDAERQQVLARNERDFERYGLAMADIVELAAQARSTGYAFNPGLILPGVFGVGVPVYRDGTVAAAISVIAIEQRLDRARRAEIARIARTAIGRLPHFSAAP